MAIFGKKKEKAAAGADAAPASGSPSLDGTAARSPTQSGSRDGHVADLAGAASNIHGPNGSISGRNAPGMAAPYSASATGSLNGPPGAGPPGAASGFKFGGPPSRQDVVGGSGIPGPNSSSVRPRKASQDGYGPSSGAISGLPPQSGPSAGPPLSASGGPGGERPRTQQVVYPWSQRTLTMNPPRFLDETRQAPPGALSPSPFPRYGHAANSMASATGEVYLFGGLVRESVKNDLYTVYLDKVMNPPQPGAGPGASMIAGGGVNATLVQTTGEIPPPRVGHATVLVSNVLILWGGDTKVRADDKQDEALYLLNLSTREWTRVRHSSEVPGAGPVGRYGHTVSIVGSRFYVFGGQVDGTFMNDLWSFDLNSLKGTPKWDQIKPTNDAPPRRTGHASVTYKDKIYVFGGTDGQYHYNDTWCYDIPTNTWKELSCIGYIPVPREGHATCLVDDVMYIFGGRGVDGKDLGDLASFKISNQRWYMFANMGPSPSGRSGHVLTTYQNKVVVLGGESFTGGKPDDPAVVYVLDTAKIKYPPDTSSKVTTSTTGAPSQIQTGQQASGPVAQQSPISPQASQLQNQQSQGSMRKTGEANPGSRAMSPTGMEDPRRAASPTQGLGQRAAPNGLVSMMQSGGPQGVSEAPAQGGAPAGMPNQARAMSPTGQQATQTIREQRAAAALQQGAPGAPGAPSQQAGIPPAVAPPVGAIVNSSSGYAPAPYNGPRSQRSLENMRGQAGSPSTAPPGAMPTRPLNGSGGGAQDGFYQGRGPSPPSQTNGYSSPKPRHVAVTPAGGAAPAAAQPSAANSAEVEVLRKREQWLKAALAMAVKRGYVAPDSLEMPDGTSAGTRSPDLNLEGIDTGVEGSEKDKIVRALVTLKTQLADARSTITQQAAKEQDRLAEADRARAAAMQEAAFLRAKLAAVEANDVSETARLERDRSSQLERQVSESVRDAAELDRQVGRLREELQLEQQLRASAEERLAETAKRAMAAEGAQMRAHDELAALQKRTYQHESMLREAKEKVATLSSAATRHQAEHESVRGELDEANTAVERQASALMDLQAALAAAVARASEHERLHVEHRNLAQQHESTINKLRSELQLKSAEAESHAARSTDLESLLSRHRDEADTHRAAATGSLAAVLDFHKQRQAARSASNIPEQHLAKMRALEDESEQLRQLHVQTRSAADTASQALQEMRERNISLEKQHSGLRSELSAMRSQLAIALQEVARLKDQASSKDAELRDRTRAVEAGQVKTSLLRQFMTERGIAVPGDDDLSAKTGYADKRVQQLEDEIEARTRELRSTEAKLAESSAKVEMLSRSGGAATSGDAAAAERRAAAAEKELADTTASFKERMAQLENDYNTAVQFVKGTERMLRRMKDELTKYKTENANLQAEVASLRSGGVAPEESARQAAKDIEALRTRLVDVTKQSEETASENRELERKLATLISEQKEANDRSRTLADSNAGSARKQAELEGELERLESNLNSVRRELQETLALNQHLSSELSQFSKAGGAGVSAPGSASLARELNSAQVTNDLLKKENAGLAQKLQEVEDKFQLLLGRMESSHGADDPGRSSQAFSITSELDKWERAGAGLP